MILSLLVRRFDELARFIDSFILINDRFVIFKNI